MLGSVQGSLGSAKSNGSAGSATAQAEGPVVCRSDLVTTEYQSNHLLRQVVAAAVEHAMESTRGYRELHARYEGDPQSAGSMHDAGPTGRSHLQQAKVAAEARGEYIFAKPDHLGIQVRSIAKPEAVAGYCMSWLPRCF